MLLVATSDRLRLTTIELEQDHVNKTFICTIVIFKYELMNDCILKFVRSLEVESPSFPSSSIAGESI